MGAALRARDGNHRFGGTIGRTPEVVVWRRHGIDASAQPNQHEQAGFLKLMFAEGEIDFVAHGWLTSEPFRPETILGRIANLESSSEIVGKKVWFRADRFKARDLFDFATVIDREPEAIQAIQPILEARRDALCAALHGRDAFLREEFESLELIDRGRSFDDCVEAVMKVLR